MSKSWDWQELAQEKCWRGWGWGREAGGVSVQETTCSPKKNVTR